MSFGILSKIKKMFLNNNNETVSNKNLGIIMIAYMRILNHRRVYMYYSMTMPNLNEDLQKISP